MSTCTCIWGYILQEISRCMYVFESKMGKIPRKAHTLLAGRNARCDSRVFVLANKLAPCCQVYLSSYLGLLEVGDRFEGNLAFETEVKYVWIPPNVLWMGSKWQQKPSRRKPLELLLRPLCHWTPTCANYWQEVFSLGDIVQTGHFLSVTIHELANICRGKCYVCNEHQSDLVSLSSLQNVPRQACYPHCSLAEQSTLG